MLLKHRAAKVTERHTNFHRSLTVAAGVVGQDSSCVGLQPRQFGTGGAEAPRSLKAAPQGLGDFHSHRLLAEPSRLSHGRGSASEIAAPADP